MGNDVLIRITGQETVPPLIKVQYKSRIVFLFTADHLLCRIADGEAPGALIIGNFSDFKEDIKTVSGIGGYLLSDEIIFRLIKAGKLYIEIEVASKPNITLMSNQFKLKI